MRDLRSALLLYAVTDGSSGEELLRSVELACRGGAAIVQLRDKRLCGEELIAEARAVDEICKRYSVPLIVNDSPTAAIASGAAGVHVGQSDADAIAARREISDRMILGVSASTVQQAIAAERAGADYIGIGAIRATATKPDAEVVPLSTVRDICAAISIPAVAIGGIDAENLHELSGIGLAGAALVSAIFAAPDIEAACRTLRERAMRVFGGRDA